MRPTEILSAEHRVIEQVLDCLEALAAEAQATRGLDQARCGQALEFLRVLADKCHHGKEENHLFPMLIARGMSTHRGPIAVMLDEHRAGRDYLQSMTSARDSGDVDRFARAVRGYVMLLREHIGKEDGVLFPMAESMLDSEARRALLDSFHAFEQHELGSGVHERMHGIADDLARHFGVRLASERATAPAPPGCGHDRP
jgi:hemerythrin-like domain-containing protein